MDKIYKPVDTRLIAFQEMVHCSMPFVIEVVDGKPNPQPVFAAPSVRSDQYNLLSSSMLMRNVILTTISDMCTLIDRVSAGQSIDNLKILSHMQSRLLFAEYASGVGIGRANKELAEAGYKL